MAQSIYVTLETLETETSVPEVKDKNGKVIRESYGSVKHTLPRENYPTPEVFDNEELFLEWAQERGAVLSLLQGGLNDWLISDRATFKRMVDGEWSPEIAQEMVDNREWTTKKKPSKSKNVSQAVLDSGLKIARAMKQNDIPEDTIRLSLVSFKPDEVEAIMEALDTE